MPWEAKGLKPWGRVLSEQGLWVAALSSIAAAYVIAIYYMIFLVPLLWVVAVLEGFFVFAYNLEWFGGKFHKDFVVCLFLGVSSCSGRLHHADQ